MSDCANRFSLRTCSGESRALNGPNGCTTSSLVTSTTGCCTGACGSLAISTVVLVVLVLVLVLDATVVEVVAVVV